MEKTWTYRELEIREQIAQEIEKHFLTEEFEQDELDTMWNSGMKYAAKIVRGLK